MLDNGIDRVKYSPCFHLLCLVLLICISRKWINVKVALWVGWYHLIGILGFVMANFGPKWKSKLYIPSAIASGGSRCCLRRSLEYMILLGCGIMSFPILRIIDSSLSSLSVWLFWNCVVKLSWSQISWHLYH